MTVTVVPLPTIELLYEYVQKTLCSRDRLDPASIPFFATELKRRGRACGTMFHIEGPRMLKTSAVWTEDEHRILFYDSTGIRFHEVRLSDSPEEAKKGRLAA